MAKHGKRYLNHSKCKRNLNRERKKIKSNNFQNILLIVFIIIFIVSGSILLKWYINTGKTEEKYKELAQDVIIKNGDYSKDNTNYPKNYIDFEKLKNINSDIEGWIIIDGTNINYPVMKSTDNNYYLSKNFYKEQDNCGSLFLDYKSDFADKNVVIYGHNIKRGIMFSELENISNGNLGNNINITIYMPNKTMYFQVFSSYKIDPEDYSINTLVKESELDDFKQTIKKRSKISFRGEYFNSSQILTLSTCDKTGKKRVLVHAGLNEINYNDN